MGRNFDPSDFVIQYPGIYEGAAKTAMESYFAMIDEINGTEVTGADVAAGRVKSPKLGDTLVVSGNMIRFCNEKYAPEYRLMLDPELARAHGYADIFAMIGFSACDDVYTLATPPEARDTLLVSQLCHEIRNLRPVYPGDTLYMVRDRTIVTDLTPPEGSVYRHLHQQNYGTVYNQRGEAVNKVCYTLMESVKLYKSGRMPKPKASMGFGDMWEDPDWFARPEHIYTDADYEAIKRIWAQELIRGEAPLYWDDLPVGYALPDGAFGPIFEGVAPTKPYGMGVGGCRCLKMGLMDPEISKTLVRDARTGIYRAADPAVNVPPTPDGVKPFFLAPPDEKPEAGEISTADIHKTGETRAALINFMGRDIALGHIENFIGYQGRIRRVRWSIMSPDVHAALGKPVPAAESFTVFTRALPGMEGSTIPIHGLTNDLAVVKARVLDKYVEGREHIARLVFWNEDIEGRAWLTGEAELVLPAREK